MLDRLLSAALTGCVLLLTGSPAFAYYSKDLYEGEVTFTSMVEIPENVPDFFCCPPTSKASSCISPARCRPRQRRPLPRTTRQ